MQEKKEKKKIGFNEVSNVLIISLVSALVLSIVPKISAVYYLIPLFACLIYALYLRFHA
jgi:hypothetical protein